VSGRRPARAGGDRARAARLLRAVTVQGKTTDQAFGSDALSPLCQELVYGVLRHYRALERTVDAHLTRPLRGKDQDLRCLMLVGAYQLWKLRIPEHAAINETVEACGELRKPWARALVNAVLRSVAADRVPDSTDRSIEYPDWFAERIRSTYGARAEDLFAALLERAPMSLRVNVTRTSAARFRALLADADIACRSGYYPEHLILEEPMPSRRLPGHADGLVSIQDSGALLAAHLLAAARPRRVLDACAAPGGKLFHLCEKLPEADVLGLEVQPERFAHLLREAERLGHRGARLLAADASTSDWWDGRPYDAVLLDAPCSGSGTLRRHPEIRLLRRAEDLPDYQRRQLALLDSLWRMVGTGGNLLYCTCSLFQEENDNVVRQFLAANRAADAVPIQAPTGFPTSVGWQLLPASAEPLSPDGFYYALLRKAGP